MAKQRRPKIALSEKQIAKLKRQIAKQATDKALLVTIAVMADDLKLSEDKICEIAENIARYATYIDNHTVRLNELAEIIKRRTGIEFERF